MALILIILKCNVRGDQPCNFYHIRFKQEDNIRSSNSRPWMYRNSHYLGDTPDYEEYSVILHLLILNDFMNLQKNYFLIWVSLPQIQSSTFYKIDWSLGWAFLMKETNFDSTTLKPSLHFRKSLETKILMLISINFECQNSNFNPNKNLFNIVDLLRAIS